MFHNIIIIFLHCLALKWLAHPNRIVVITKYAQVHIWLVFFARCWFWSDCREKLLARMDLLHFGCFPGSKHSLSEKRNKLFNKSFKFSKHGKTTFRLRIYAVVELQSQTWSRAFENTSSSLRWIQIWWNSPAFIVIGYSRIMQLRSKFI